MNLYPEENLLLLSAKIRPDADDLKNAQKLLSEVVSWEKLALMAIKRAVAPMLYKLLSNPELKQRVTVYAFGKLEAAYYTTLRRNMLLLNAWVELAPAFNQAGIRLVALKGIYLSEHLYGDIGIRQLSDIDVLVSPFDGKKALEVLKRLGYRTTENPFSPELGMDKDFVHYPPMVREGISVEVHIRLHRPHSSYKLDTNAFIERSEPVLISGTPAYTLSFYDQLLFLCVHSEKHFTGSKIQFTCFADLANILFKFSDLIDWERLITLSRENRCEEVVFKHLLLTSRFMNAPVPESYRKKYIKTVTSVDEVAFIRFLRGYMFAGNHFGSFYTNVTVIKSFRGKINFIAGNLFPSKSYMVQRYHIRNEKLFWIYYPYRFYIAFSSLFGKLKSNAKWVKER